MAAITVTLNNEVAHLVGMKPYNVIKVKRVAKKPSSVAAHSARLFKQKLPLGIGVCYLFQPGMLEGGW